VISSHVEMLLIRLPLDNAILFHSYNNKYESHWRTQRTGKK
jgi:hypothetical protein